MLKDYKPIDVIIPETRQYLFTVNVGSYDVTLMTSLIRRIEFFHDYFCIEYFDDEKHTVYNAFDSLGSSFGDSYGWDITYLDRDGNELETYYIMSSKHHNYRVRDLPPTVDHGEVGCCYQKFSMKFDQIRREDG